MDRLEPARDGAHHQVAVAARADERVRAEEVVFAEGPAGGRELTLVGGTLGGGPAPPGRVDLHEGVLHVVALARPPPQVWRALPAAAKRKLQRRSGDETSRSIKEHTL